MKTLKLVKKVVKYMDYDAIHITIPKTEFEILEKAIDDYIPQDQVLLFWTLIGTLNKNTTKIKFPVDK